MTTKTKSVVTTEIAMPGVAPTPVPVVLTMGRLPHTITLTGPLHTVLPQSVVLARNGYTYDLALPQMVYVENGFMYLHMTLGTPEQQAIEGAKQLTADALAEEAREFDKLVQAAAKKLADDAAKAVRDAELAAKIAEQRQALAALEAAVQAAA